MSRQREIDWYIKSYPGIEKWLNGCPLCHRRGYRSDMPEHIGGEHSVSGYHLRRYFQPLETDEAGLCMVCSEIQKIADGKPGNGMETGDSKKYEHI